MSDSGQKKSFYQQTKSTAVDLISHLKENASHEEAQQTAQKMLTLSNWANDSQQIVTNILKAANNLQTLPQKTVMDVQERLDNDFKSQFKKNIHALKSSFQNGTRNLESFQLYETNLHGKTDFILSMNQKMQILNPIELNGLKLTKQGNILAQNITQGGEFQNVLCAQIKDEKKTINVGYATEGGIYIPDNNGGFFITSKQTLSQDKSLNTAFQKGSESEAALTILHIQKKESPFSQIYTGGVVDGNAVIDAAIQYTHGSETITSSMGAEENAAGIKTSYEKKLGEYASFSCQILASDETAQLKLMYVDKQPQAIHKLALLINNQSTTFNYNIQSDNNWFLDGLIDYNDTAAHPLSAVIKTGYQKDF